MPASNLSNDPFVQITMGMFDMIERYRKENDALQEMLRRRDLKPRQLRKEMNEILKNPKPLFPADQQFQELCEGMRVFLEQNRANQALLAKIPVSENHQ